MYAFSDLTYREIAGALRIPTGTVRSRLARARQRFGDLARCD
jgi:DNA-directed RNA polymerase specialized sigma24 family protein